MHDSEESSRAFGSNSCSPIRGHGRGRGRGRDRGRGRGRVRPQHGFAQGHRSPLRQRGVSPYHSPRGVQVHSAMAKTDQPIGVVAVLMMNRSYHVSYLNSLRARNARFS
jgi:hypothetical protein